MGKILGRIINWMSRNAFGRPMIASNTFIKVNLILDSAIILLEYTYHLNQTNDDTKVQSEIQNFKQKKISYSKRVHTYFQKNIKAKCVIFLVIVVAYYTFVAPRIKIPKYAQGMTPFYTENYLILSDPIFRVLNYPISYYINNERTGITQKKADEQKTLQKNFQTTKPLRKDSFIATLLTRDLSNEEIIKGYKGLTKKTSNDLSSSSKDPNISTITTNLNKNTNKIDKDKLLAALIIDTFSMREKQFILNHYKLNQKNLSP